MKYFNQELNIKLDKTEKLKNIAEFDSLEVVNFLLAFEEKFGIEPNTNCRLNIQCLRKVLN